MAFRDARVDYAARKSGTGLDLRKPKDGVYSCVSGRGGDSQEILAQQKFSLNPVKGSTGRDENLCCKGTFSGKGV